MESYDATGTEKYIYALPPQYQIVDWTVRLDDGDCRIYVVTNDGSTDYNRSETYGRVSLIRLDQELTLAQDYSVILEREEISISRAPTEAMPGKLDLYPYHEVSILPQMVDIGADEVFAIFMNPKRIQHGNRRGIEIKKFDGTTESLEYGELFLRFRKRDGFLVTRPKGNMVVLKTKA